jgi:hypothetical protein
MVAWGLGESFPLGQVKMQDVKGGVYSNMGKGPSKHCGDQVTAHRPGRNFFFFFSTSLVIRTFLEVGYVCVQDASQDTK